MIYKFLFYFIFIVSSFNETLVGQGWARMLAKAATKADDAGRAATTAAEAQKAIITAKSLRWTKAPSWAINAKKSAFWYSEYTDDVGKIDGFLLVNDNKIELRSNLRADESKVYCVSAPLGTIESNVVDTREYVRVLISHENIDDTRSFLDNAYKNMRLRVDPSIFEKVNFENINWGSKNKIYLFDGENSYVMRILKSANGEVEPAIEMGKNFYRRITTREFCTAVDYATVLYDSYMFLTNAKALEIESNGIQTNLNSSVVEHATQTRYIGSFISELTAAGYVLVDVTCQADEMIKKYVYEVYEEPSASDYFLNLADKIGDVEVTIKQPNLDESKGMAVGWKILIWVVVIFIVLGIIGSFIKD